MGDRIEQFRDGQLQWLELTPQERERVRLLGTVIHESRRAVEPADSPDVTLAVMRRLEGVRPKGRVTPPLDHVRLRRLLFDRRRVVMEFRVAQLLAAAAVLVLLAGAGRTQLSPSSLPAERPPVFVQFRLHAPDAATVQLAGSFSQWRADHVLHEITPGVWVVTIAMESGIHDYSFLVDGTRWVVDPYAPAVADGFGGSANRLALLPTPQQS